MKEIKSIIKAYDLIDPISTQSALATVVRVEGSSYRRTGARMLVQDNGNWVGGISGGCLEGDALKRARMAISSSRSSLVTYDTTKNDAHQIGVGLGCQGIIEVLFTPLDYHHPQNPLEVLKACIQDNIRPEVLLTLTEMEGPWEELELGRVIWYRSNQDLAVFLDPTLILILEENIRERLEKGVSSNFYWKGYEEKNLRIFIEILPPEIHLIGWGNQYDINPLVSLAKELGWKVSLVSEAYRIDPSIKPLLSSVFKEEEFPDHRLGFYTALVLLAHDYKQDKLHLKKALKTQIPYIGILGPKIRTEKLIQELESEGVFITEKDKERIYSPAGLDLGATSPDEIALSILAEIRAVFSGRKGGFLKLRTSAIHERPEL